MSEQIVFLDRATVPEHIVFKEPEFPHQWAEYPITGEGQIIDRAADATVIITNKVPLSAATLEHLPKLKHIAVIATGYNIIDTDACRERGIAVSNTRGYASISVPEHTIALMFALRRHLFAYQYSLQRGEWQTSPFFHHYLHQTLDLAGSRMGIIGSGELGRGTAKIAKGIGMEVVFADRKGQMASGKEGFMSFDEVIATSDVVSLHCPLTETTRDLIALKEMQQMKPMALLLNTSRGGLVNEQDLVTALDQQLIAGAGFDVATQEPIRPDNPLLSLLDRPNFILTPHIAWTTTNAMQTQANQLIANIESFVNGQSQNRVV